MFGCLDVWMSECLDVWMFALEVQFIFRPLIGPEITCSTASAPLVQYITRKQNGFTKII